MPAWGLVGCTLGWQRSGRTAPGCAGGFIWKNSGYWGGRERPWDLPISTAFGPKSSGHVGAGTGDRAQWQGCLAQSRSQPLREGKNSSTTTTPRASPQEKKGKKNPFTWKLFSSRCNPTALPGIFNSRRSLALLIAAPALQAGDDSAEFQNFSLFLPGGTGTFDASHPIVPRRSIPSGKGLKYPKLEGFKAVLQQEGRWGERKGSLLLRKGKEEPEMFWSLKGKGSRRN